MTRNSLKILAIDDHPNNLISLKALICNAFLDATVYTASTGKKGIELAKQYDPSVILLDILMPEEDGFEICRQIKEDEELEMIPVVFVTAMEATRETRINALTAGAEGFLSKPIDELELIAQIKAMVKIKVANRYRQMERDQLNQLVLEKTRDLEQELEKITRIEEQLSSSNFELEQNQKALLNLMEDMQVEIENSKRLEAEVAIALKNEQARSFELETLLEAAKSILHEKSFDATIKSLFEQIKKLTGAKTGYYALFNQIQSPSLDMVNRGFHKLVCQSNEAQFQNDFTNTPWFDDMPKKHLPIDNILYAPLTIEDKTEGMMVLANKKEGFTKEDARIAGAFGNLASLALDHWKNREKLLESEERFRATLMQSQDGIIIADENMQIIEWNDAQSRILGYSKEEMLGKPIWEVQWLSLPDQFRNEHRKEELKQACLHMMQVNQALSSEFPSFSQEFEIQSKTNEKKVLEISSYAIQLSNKTYFGSISRDITEQKLQEKMKDHFISMVSHELRTPMTSIKGGIDMLCTMNLESYTKESQNLIQICKKNADRLCTFVNNVLDFQKLKNSSLSFDLSIINIDKIIQDVICIMEIPAKEKHLELRYLSCPQTPNIEGDSDKIYRLLSNLLSNGIKYTEKGYVSIECSLLPQEKSVQVAIRDTGMGIHKEDVKKLFNSFTQITHSNYSRPGSSGLGLAICKEIVEKHHGKIWLESIPGEGTVFYVQLPIKQSNQDNES
ncbi:MAG TPA: ATP-binding protein [Caldisericia bacterium]|nr:ATP-binding protein [Caldisericia bacterium]